MRTERRAGFIIIICSRAQDCDLRRHPRFIFHIRRRLQETATHCVVSQFVTIQATGIPFPMVVDHQDGVQRVLQVIGSERGVKLQEPLQGIRSYWHVYPIAATPH